MKKLIVIAGLLFNTLLFSQFINVDTSIPESQLAWDKLVHTCPTGISNFSYKGADSYGLPYKSIAYFTSNGSSFPISSGVVLSTGNVMSAIGPNTSMQDNGNLAAWGGDTDLDTTINTTLSGVSFTSTNATYMQFDFVPIADTFSFNFLFASEEYGTRQCNFSDSFAFLLTDISAGGTAVNLALIPSTTIPISVASIRDALYNNGCSTENQSYFASYNGGSNAITSATNFEGQTVPMSAHATIIPGHTYRIKIVIADNSIYEADSAIFIDSQNFNTGTQIIQTAYQMCDPSQQSVSPIQITPNIPPIDLPNYSFVWTDSSGNQLIGTGTNGSTLSTSTAGTYTLTYTLNGSTCPYPTNSTVLSYYPTINVSATKTLYTCQTSVPYRYDLTLNNIAPTTGSYTTTYHSTAPTSATDNANIITTPYTSATGIQTVYVRVVDNTTGCFVVRSFNLRLTSPATSSQNITLVACENQTAGVGNGTANINLATYINGTSTDNPQSLLNGLSTTLYTVSFFTSTGAPIANASSYQYTNGEIVNAVISIKGDADTDCNITRTITLTFKPKAPLYALATATTIYACGSYTLPNISSLSPYQGNYFYDNAGTSPVTNLTITTDTVIYIYSPNTTTYCENYKKYTIKIVTAPTLPSDFAGTHCVPYQLPTVSYGKFYTQPNGAGTAYNSGATISSVPATNPLTLYWYYNNTTTTGNNCPIQSGPFVLTFQNAPVAQADVLDCTSYTLPALASGLSYHTASNGGGTSLSAGNPITSTQNIYVYNGNCDDSFKVTIGNTGFPTSSTQCAGYQITLPVGILHDTNSSGVVLTQPYTVNSTKTFFIELPTRAGANYSCISTTFTITVPTPTLPTIPNQAPVCESFAISSLPTLPTGVYYYNGTHAGGATPTQYVATDIISNSSHTTQLIQTIYLYTQDSVTGCTAEDHFDITINPVPDISNIELSDVPIPCGNTTGYPLSVLPAPPTNVTYTYNTAPNGSGTAYIAGDYINQTMTLYVVATDTTTNCKSYTDFTITDDRATVTVPTINPNDINGCGTYTLTQAIVGTGVIVYDANNGINTPTMSNQIALPQTFSANTTVYLWKDNGNPSNYCYDIKPFNIQIFTTPTVQAPPTALTGCGTYTLPTLTAGNYYYDGTHASGATPTQITSLTYTNTTQIPETHTVWTYNPNPAHPGCFGENSFTITVYPTPVVATANQVATQSVCGSFTLPAFTGANHHYYNSAGTEIPPLTTVITTLGANNFTIKNIDPTTLCESTPYAFTITIYEIPQASLWTAPTTNCGPLAFTLASGYTLYNGSHAGGGTPTVVTSPINNSGTYYISNNLHPVCETPINITINTIPTVDSSQTLSGCSDTGVTLPAFTNANNHYFIGTTEYFPGNTFNSSQVVDIKAYDANCTNSTINHLTINITQAPATSIWTAGNYGCGNLPFTLPAGYTLYNSSNAVVTSPITTSGNYYIADSTLTSCRSSAIAITIESYPTLDSSVPSAITICSGNYSSGYTLPALAANNEYYLNGTTLWSQSTPVPVNVSTYNFVIKAISTSGCANPTTRSLTLTINQTPNIPTQTPVYACNSYTLPSLPTGWAYYDGSHAGGGTINTISAGTSINSSQTVWVYAETGTNCSDEESLTINIFNVSEPSIPATVCSGYALPALTNGNYYTSYNAGTQTASNMLTSTTLTATTSTAMTIYVWGQSGYSPNCSDVYTINVTVEPSAQAFVSAIPTTVLTFCDNDTNTTNSYTVPGLHTLYDSYILGSQTGSNFNIAYYNTNNDATNQTNPITDATVNPIWVRVNNSTAPSQCSYDIKQINFIINPMPNPSLGNPVICMNANGTVQNPATITASLPSGNYTYVWTVPTGVTNPGNVASFTTTVVDAYSVLVTNNTTGCTMTTPAVTNVIQSIEPTVTYTASEDFADSTTITIFASPVGNYLYQIDGGNYQSSPVFTNIGSGHHTVVVKDLYGCNPTSPVDIYIVNYPHFFTPNGDGHNDYWNIKDLRHFGVFKIRIFDRYDKLIKEIGTNTPGWDGMYNNEMLPADDYWFTIDYYKDGVNRQYKSHFALIR